MFVVYSFTIGKWFSISDVSEIKYFLFRLKKSKSIHQHSCTEDLEVPLSMKYPNYRGIIFIMVLSNVE